MPASLSPTARDLKRRWPSGDWEIVLGTARTPFQWPASLGGKPVSREQRFSRDHPCPVCGGFDGGPRQKGTRCFGFLSNDRAWANCTREEYAGALVANPDSQSYGHRVTGPCGCGFQHGAESPAETYNPRGDPTAVYPYRDERGTLLFEVVRYNPKAFSQRRPNGAGGYVWNLHGVRRVLYRLAETLEAAAAGRTVYVTEGERDADALAALGLAVTTNPGGAGKWREEYAGMLRETRRAVLLPHNDAPGREHGQAAARSLYNAGVEVAVLELPGLADKGDVSDWLRQGGTREALEELAAAASVWAQSQPPKPPSLVTLASSIQPLPIRWVWPGRIPSGMVTVMDGDPGLGKSTVTLDIAARVSRGEVMPGAGPALGASYVLVLTAEDDLARTVRPRLEAAAANLDRIGFVHVPDKGGTREPEITVEDLALLEREIIRLDVKLVIIDPLMAYLPAEVNAHRDQDVRRAMAALRSLAERTGTAILVVRHLTKTPGAPAIYRGGGSIGIIGAARAGLLIAADPDQTEGRILAAVKMNLAPMPPAVRFRLVQDDRHAFPQVQWGVRCDLTADVLLADRDNRANPRARAADFLRARLADGPVAAEQIEREVKSLGISIRTLKRAREELGVHSRHVGAPGEPSYWELSLP